MPRIATLTMNPTIDVAYEVERVVPVHKMRTLTEQYDPGGGGINVARVFVRLGGSARCFYLSGGAPGAALDGLLDLHQLDRTRIPIAQPTRISTAVLEQETGKEYRFNPPGPRVSPEELQHCLNVLAEADGEFLVASGSLPPGVPDDFYARVAALMKPRGVRVVLDSSGGGLRGGLAGGNLFLVKPSLGELRKLVGRELSQPHEIAEAALALVARGSAQNVAVTMGYEGALLANADGVVRLPALDIVAKSTVGAGDSFVASMVFAVASGWDMVDAFRFGIAGGSAAVLTPGTDLCRPEDIHRLYPLVPSPAA
jgi:6-phosphofructokinase 2